MPLNRYQIRNEYSLADPELYRAADKDDPEALLEGVAMAGLVGVLRQLGDLAEWVLNFACYWFWDWALGDLGHSFFFFFSSCNCCDFCGLELFLSLETVESWDLWDILLENLLLGSCWISEYCGYLPNE